MESNIFDMSASLWYLYVVDRLRAGSDVAHIWAEIEGVSAARLSVRQQTRVSGVMLSPLCGEQMGVPVSYRPVCETALILSVTQRLSNPVCTQKWHVNILKSPSLLSCVCDVNQEFKALSPNLNKNMKWKKKHLDFQWIICLFSVLWAVVLPSDIWTFPQRIEFSVSVSFAGQMCLSRTTLLECLQISKLNAEIIKNPLNTRHTVALTLWKLNKFDKCG